MLIEVRDIAVDTLTTLPVAAYTTDADGLITQFNDAAVALWGRAPTLGCDSWSGFAGLRWADGTPLVAADSPMARVVREGRAVRDAEVWGERADGSRVLVAVSSNPLRDDRDRVAGAVHVLVDVTGRLGAELADAHLAAIVSSSNDAVISKTFDGTITSWNDAATRILGYTADEMIGGSIRRIIPAHLQAEEDEIIARVGRGERLEHFETRRLAKDGRLVDLSITVSPVRDRHGRLIGASKVARDVTEARQSALAVARLAAIVDSSDDAIIGKTLEGRVTSWNAAATRIFGYAPEEMVGQSILRLIPPELQAEEAHILARVAAGRRVEHFDTERLAKDGRRINVSLTISPVRDRDGVVIGASKIVRDIEERKRQEALRQLLFNELNHRVKNTLAMIQAIASQSLRAAASPDEFAASFGGRVQALARAHDLLVEGEFRGASVAGLIREQVALAASEPGRITFAGPEVMLSPRVSVQLALVLHELATNARKHGALAVPGGHLAVDWVVGDGPPRALSVSWRESGVGVVTPPRRRGFGTLLIERTLASNGGSAQLAYGPDGLTCTLRLSIPDEPSPVGTEPTRPGPPAEPASVTRPDGRLHGRRILVVEDEPLVALALEDELARHGCIPLGPAPDIETALRFIAATPFDAALLDGNLAGRTVEPLAAALDAKGVPFAFVSGYGPEALPEGWRDRPLVAKPFDPVRLVATVHELLAATAVR